MASTATTTSSCPPDPRFAWGRTSASRADRRPIAWLAVVSTLVIVSACALLPPARWKVDVVNGERPLLISITTGSASWAWLVPADGRMVLLDEPAAPTDGTIELIDPGRDCVVLDAAAVPLGSFTIRPVRVRVDPPEFDLGIEDGASLVAPVSKESFGGCSG